MKDDDEIFGSFDPDTYQLWRSSINAPSVLTKESLLNAAEKALNDYLTLPPEIHSPKCPKYLTQGKKACRCGMRPLEAVLEDELEK